MTTPARPTVLVVGLGETGSELVRRLVRHFEVVGIDPDERASERTSTLSGASDTLRLSYGDATSALVLRKADLEGMYAAVACAGSDEVNLEALRVARDLFGVANRYALMYEKSWQQRYRDEDIDVVEQSEACASVLESRVERGKKTTSAVELVSGEMIAVEVLPNSSVAGRTLEELHPRRWLVGSIRRQGRLIVPHGDTVFVPGDRVLIIGEPDILPSIATMIQKGESEFPVQYGSNVVSIWSADMDDVIEEAGYLIDATRAEKLEVIACEAPEDELTALAERCKRDGIACEFTCSAGNTQDSLLQELVHRDVGVLLLPSENLSFFSRIGLGRSETARIIDRVTSPVLVSRKSFPYNKVLLALAELPFHSSATQLAVDLVRMLGAELHLAVVRQPELVVGTEFRQQIHIQQREVENCAGMYHVDVNTVVLEGNPVAEVERISRKFDLLVLPYQRKRRGFLTKPDVGLNLIHRAHCSVLVMPC